MGAIFWNLGCFFLEFGGLFVWEIWGSFSDPRKWLSQVVLHGKRVVVLNMDESPIQLQVALSRGYHSFSGAADRKQVRAPISLKDSRFHATLVCTWEKHGGHGSNSILDSAAVYCRRIA